MAKPEISLADIQHSDPTPEQNQQEEEQQPQPAPPDALLENPETQLAASQPVTSPGEVSPRPADAVPTTSQARDSKESRVVQPTKKKEKKAKTSQDTSKRAVVRGSTDAVLTPSQPGVSEERRDVRPAKKGAKTSETLQVDTSTVLRHSAGTLQKPLKAGASEVTRKGPGASLGLEVYTIDDAKRQEKEKEQQPGPPGEPSEKLKAPPASSPQDTSTREVPPRPGDATSTLSQARDSEVSKDIRPTKKPEKIPKTLEDTARGAVAQSSTGTASKHLKLEAFEVTQKSAKSSDDLDAYSTQEAIPRLLAAATVASSERQRVKIPPTLTLPPAIEDEDDNEQLMEASSTTLVEAAARRAKLELPSGQSGTPAIPKAADPSKGAIPKRPTGAALSASGSERATPSAMPLQQAVEEEKKKKKKKNKAEKRDSEEETVEMYEAIRYSTVSSSSGHERAKTSEVPIQHSVNEETSKEEKKSKIKENVKNKPVQDTAVASIIHPQEISWPLDRIYRRVEITRALAEKYQELYNRQQVAEDDRKERKRKKKEKKDKRKGQKQQRAVANLPFLHIILPTWEGCPADMFYGAVDVVTANNEEHEKLCQGGSSSSSGLQRVRTPQVTLQQAAEEESTEKKAEGAESGVKDKTVPELQVLRLVLPRKGDGAPDVVYPAIEILSADVEENKVLHEDAVKSFSRPKLADIPDVPIQRAAEGEVEAEKVKAAKSAPKLVVPSVKIPQGIGGIYRAVEIVRVDAEEYEAMQKEDVPLASRSEHAKSPEVLLQPAAEGELEGETVAEEEPVPELTAARVILPQGISTNSQSVEFIRVCVEDYEALLKKGVWSSSKPERSKTPEVPLQHSEKKEETGERAVEEESLSVLAVPRLIIQEGVGTSYREAEFIRIFVEEYEALLMHAVRASSEPECAKSHEAPLQQVAKEKKTKEKGGEEEGVPELNVLRIILSQGEGCVSDGTYPAIEVVRADVKKYQVLDMADISRPGRGKIVEVPLQETAQAGEEGEGQRRREEIEGAPELKVPLIILPKGKRGPPDGTYAAVKVVKADGEESAALHRGVLASSSWPEEAKPTEMSLQPAAEKEQREGAGRGEEDAVPELSDIRILLPQEGDGPPDGIYAAVEIVSADVEESKILHRSAVVTFSELELAKTPEMLIQQTTKEKKGREEEDAVPELLDLRVILPQGRCGPPDGIYRAVEIVRTDVKEVEILHSGNLHEKVLYYFLIFWTRDKLGEEEAIKKTSELLKMNVATVRRIVKG